MSGAAHAIFGWHSGTLMGRTARWLVDCALPMLLLWLCATAAHAAFSFAPKSFNAATPVIYLDSSVSLTCGYQAFDIASTTAVANSWAKIGTFSGVLSLGGLDDGIFQLGAYTAGQTKTAFFYVCSSVTATTGPSSSVAGNTFSVTVHDINPNLPGAVQLGLQSYSVTVDNSSNTTGGGTGTVTAILAGPNPPVLGGIMSLTVTGDVGNLGTNDPLQLTPAAYTSWRADAFELIATNVILSGANAGSFDNQLFFSVPSNGATSFTATYYFRAVTTTAAPTSLSPIAYRSSPSKHTNTTAGVYATSLLPMDPATNTLTLAKLVNTATLPAVGGTVSYTLRLTNTSAYAISVDDIVDTLPASPPAAATYVSNSSIFNGAAIGNPSIASGVLTWSGPFSIPAGGSRDLVFQASIPGTAGLYTNSAIAHIGTTIIDTTLTTTDNAPATAQTRVLLAPVIAKSFTPNATAIGGTLQLLITLSNRNPNVANALAGVAFNDTYGGTLVNSAAPNLSTTCTGGTLAGGAAGGGSTGISGVSLAAGASCTVTVDVTSVTATAATNTTGTVSSTNGGTGNTASAAYAFTAQPTLVKSFTPAFIAPGAVSSLSVVITNNSAGALTSLAFSDSLLGGLVVAGAPNLVNNCGGTVTGAAANSTSISLSGGSIAAAGGTCRVEVSVTAPAGIYNNTTSGATSNIAGTGPVSNMATLTVNSPPTITKVFSPVSISRNGTSTLTITLNNPNATPLTGVAFTDNYPANLVNAVTPALTSTCGTVAAASNATNPGMLTLTGGVMPANSSCTVTVSVTSATAASYPNSIPIGGLTTANAGSNTVAASATLTVTAAPSAVKSFSAVPSTGISTLTITITNNHTAGITAMGFTDTFPAGLSVVPAAVLTANPATNTCGGTLTAAADAASISLAAAAITAAGGTCTVSVPVVASAAGLYNNQTSGVASSVGTGSPSNVATLIAPALSKTFSPATAGPGDTTRLTITVTNPSLTTALTGVQFADLYPANLTNTASPAYATTCSGATIGGATSGSAAGTTGISITGGTVPAGGSCSVSANVSAPIGATVPTAYYNQTGTVRSNQGIGIDTADTLIVTNRPTITKTFSDAAGTAFATASTILLGQTSKLRLIIENNHSAAISGMSFSDTLPAGMTVAATPNLSNSCGGTVTGATAGSASLRLSGGSIAAASPTGTCTLTVDVTATPAASYSNQTSGVISTTVSPNPGPVSNIAVLTVNLNPPTAAKAFSPATIAVNGISTLTVTLTNPGTNSSAITGVGFTDTYPAGMTTAGTPGISGCGGGSVTAAGGGNSLILSGASIAVNSSCVVTVSVTAATAGSLVNTIPAGSISSTNAGISAAAVSAALNVYASPTVVKSFTPASIASGGTSSMVIAVSSPSANPGNLAGVSIGDTYTGTLVNNAAGSVSCTGGSSATLTGGANAGTSVGLSGGTLAPGGTCTITQSVTATSTNTNTTGAPAATGPLALTGTAAAATLFVVTAPTFSKAFAAPKNIAVTGNTTLTFTLTNPNAGALTGAAFTDDFPSGLSLFNTTLSGTCAGGSVTSRLTTGAAPFGAITAGHISIQAAGYTIPALGSCTVIVNLTSSTAGAKANTSSTLTTAQGTTTAAASDTLNVYSPPTVVKTFTPSTIASGGIATMEITVTNPAANPGNLTGVSISDAYTGTLTNNAAGSVSCTGAGSATLAGGVNAGVNVGFGGGTIVPGGTCTITQFVTAASTNINTTSTPAATGPLALAGTAAAATLTVVAAPAFTKAFGAEIAVNGNTTLTFTLTNPNATALTGATLTDDFPASVSLFNTTVGGTCAGGAVVSRLTIGATAFGAITAGHISIQAAGYTIPASGNCTVIVHVTASSAGAKLNTSSTLTTAQGTTTAAASDTLNVYTAATVTKTFTPASIAAGGTSSMVIVVTNPAANPGNLTGVSIGDIYTGTLTNNAAGSVSCSGAGSATLTGGANAGASVGFGSGTIVPGGTCTITQSVTATSSNTNSTTAPVSTGTASGVLALSGSSASAVLTVTSAVASPDLTLIKTHSGNFVVGGTYPYTLTVHNTLGSAPTSATITVIDTLPAGLTYVAAGTGGTGWSCSVSGQVVTCATASVINTGASGNPLTINVLAGAAAQPSVTNSAAVSGGGESGGNSGNNSATDVTSVVGVSSLLTDGAQTVMAGGSVTYSHQFLAGGAGAVSFSTESIPNPAMAGWSHLLYRDFNCNGVLDGSDAAAVLSGAVAVAAGDQVCILVKEFVPAGAATGAQDQITVTATLVPAAGAPSNYTRTDLTTVGASSMTASKEVRNVSTAGAFGTNNAALPGQTLEYRVTFTNTGTATLSSVIVNDATPVYTTYVGGSAGCPGLVTRTTCTVIAEPANATAGTIQWSMTGTFAAGATATVSFQVKVD